MMFDQVFKNNLSDFTEDENLKEKLWLEIKMHYNSPERHYHNLKHLDNLFQELLPVKGNIEDWSTVLFSIAYHDIIYDTHKQDNEERSADLAYNRLTELNRSGEQNEKCKQQILATKTHDTADADTNHFTDADLAILGSDPPLYSNYSEQIRKEYKHYPDFLYKPGRKKVLLNFLKMDSIFKTEYFKLKYESMARSNILAEIESL